MYKVSFSQSVGHKEGTEGSKTWLKNELKVTNL